MPEGLKSKHPEDCCDAIMESLVSLCSWLAEGYFLTISRHWGIIVLQSNDKVNVEHTSRCTTIIEWCIISSSSNNDATSACHSAQTASRIPSSSIIPNLPTVLPAVAALFTQLLRPISKKRRTSNQPSVRRDEHHYTSDKVPRKAQSEE